MYGEVYSLMTVITREVICFVLQVRYHSTLYQIECTAVSKYRK